MAFTARAATVSSGAYPDGGHLLAHTPADARAGSRADVTPRATDRTKLAVAAVVFASAVGIAILRVGFLSHVGSLRVGAPAAMNDFYSSVYFPVRAFLA